MRPGWFCVKGKVFPFIQGAGLESCAQSRHAQTHTGVPVSHCVCVSVHGNASVKLACMCSLSGLKNKKDKNPTHREIF